MLKAELGKVSKHQVYLENPSKLETVYNTIITNPSNYDVLPEQGVIPPYGKAVVSIIYVPSDLNIIQTSDIICESPDIGKWKFAAIGLGLPPT